MNEIVITFAVLAALVGLFAWGKLPVEVVAVGAALVLGVTGVLTYGEALAGFGDPVVLFIASLFIVSEALDSTGITTWAGQRLMALAGDSRLRLVVLMILVVALLTAIVSVNASVAALLPVIIVTATRLGLAPSKLLIPLCFGAHAGSQLALTGSNVNMLTSEALLDTTGSSMGFFEFALTGVPLLFGTMLVIVLLGDRLLPVRSPRTISRDLSDHARTLARQYGVDLGGGDRPGEFSPTIGLLEIVIPPRSPFIGTTVFRGMITDSGDLAIDAVQRLGEDLGERQVELQVGDALVLRGPWTALDARASDPGLLAVDDPALVRRQSVPLGLRAKEALLVLAGMVLLLVTNVVPPAVAGLVAAGTLIVLGVVSIERAYRAVNWTTVVMVAAMLPLSTAMFSSGAADLVSETLIDVVGAAGPHGLLVGLFVVTAIFGQLISNTATALIMIPIGIVSAAELGVDVKPVLMSINVAAAAALLTPVATPVNLIAMDAAGYRFGDYWRLGAAVMVVFFLVSVVLVPIVWPF